MPAAAKPDEEVDPADPDHPQYGHGYQAGLAAGASAGAQPSTSGVATLPRMEVARPSTSIRSPQEVGVGAGANADLFRPVPPVAAPVVQPAATPNDSAPTPNGSI